MSTELDPIVRHGPFNRADAFAFLKKHARKRAIFVHAEVFLPTDGDRGFPGMCNVEVNRRGAEKYLGDVLSEVLDRRGARIRMSISTNCLFIGSST